MIKDKFTKKKLSRQRKYQLRHLAHGLCYLCNNSAVMAGLCPHHIILRRERQRRARGCKRRNINSKSYKMEKEIK